MQIQYFKDLPLSPEVMRSINDIGFDTLFPIQAQAIKPLLEGKDVIGQAKTGTGKTAAFGIPMVEQIDPRDKSVQGLVLVPTRELAVQVADHIRQFSKYSGLRVLPVYGGQSVANQIRVLERGVHIVVGTPGRTIDLIERKKLRLDSVKVVVLDEADRMLDMGFIEDMEYILSKVPSNRQTSLFSATIDQPVMDVCGRYMENPEEILVSRDEIALSEISQYYVIINPKDKFINLCKVLDENHIKRAIIFCKTRIGVSRLTNRLKRRSYNAEALHGGFTQRQRDSVMEDFRRGRVKLLIATDVAARGLDIEGITHVINYDVPLEAKVYFHRIGRTARMGRKGTAITFVSYVERSALNRIRNLTNTPMKELGRSEENRELHIAVCSECGKDCEVPFKPNPNGPVYCSGCWKKRRLSQYINII
ncbi:MAG: DEAD/DEAH box helicase [Candidatus Bathyarchaeota archaeon]|nr:DEAD/DEAH box helicase [Candidatus Bathyarchaeota archaeon]